MLDFFPHPPPFRIHTIAVEHTLDYGTRAVCRIYLGENKIVS
jgi:hypothetical protein